MRPALPTLRSRPSRWKRALALVLLVAPLAGLAAPFDSRADTRASVGTAGEDEAYGLYKDEKYLTARTRAQAILDADPQSVVGHYVLGSVLRDAEGSLPRAMAHLREARRLFEVRHVGHEKGEQGLHKDILWGLQFTAGLMEQLDLQLRTLDEYDRLFAPGAPAQHAWPLMKLRRFDEARAFVSKGLATSSTWQRITALNTLCAIEGEAHQRQAAYDACKHVFDEAQKRVAASHEKDPKKLPGITVYAHNASLGALTMLRFDEAERLALAGTRRLERTGTNPWRVLAGLYLGEGRADDTVAALREMQRWSAHQPPEHRDQSSAANDGLVAEVLLAAGEAGMGIRLISRALDRPDRRGRTSSNAEQSLGGHAVMRRALLRLDAELTAERASSQSIGKRAVDVASSLARRAQAWPDEERAIAVLSDDDRLVMSLRPYEDGGVAVPEWLTGELVGLLGPGVVGAALARARAEDSAFPGMTPYFDATEVEIALARGETRRAAELASTTLDRLPQAEALLRARVAALGAEAAARDGQVRVSVGLFERALQLDPGVVRRLGLSIPAVVEVAGGGAAGERAGVLLRRSPRLRSVASAFVVRVEGDGTGLRACLLTPSAAKLGCGVVAATAGEAPESLAVRVAEAFHRSAFAMKFSLTPTDLRSLDGSTTMAQGSAREALRGLLGNVPAGDGDGVPPPSP